MLGVWVTHSRSAAVKASLPTEKVLAWDMSVGRGISVGGDTCGSTSACSLSSSSYTPAVAYPQSARGTKT